jgi:hypothetical protein
MVWTKLGANQRIDIVTERRALGGLSEIAQGEDMLSCTWATDEGRELIDASCLRGDLFLGRTLLAFFRENMTVDFVGNRSIIDISTECFRVSLLSHDVGTVCLSASGEPLSVDVDPAGNARNAVAVQLDSSRHITTEDVLTPIIPSATFGMDTHVKGVNRSSLALPSLSILDEGLTP